MSEPLKCPACGGERKAGSLDVAHTPECQMEEIIHTVAEYHRTLAPMNELPVYCFGCGAYLMGGATKHEPGCPVGKLIEEFWS
jgi:hypothetical protein